MESDAHTWRGVPRVRDRRNADIAKDAISAPLNQETSEATQTPSRSPLCASQGGEEAPRINFFTLV